MKTRRSQKSQTQFELMVILFLAFLFSMSFSSVIPKPIEATETIDALPAVLE